LISSSVIRLAFSAVLEDVFVPTAEFIILTLWFAGPPINAFFPGQNIAVDVNERYQKEGKKGHRNCSAQINRDQTHDNECQNVLAHSSEFWCSFFKMAKDNISDGINDTYDGHFKPQ